MLRHIICLIFLLTAIASFANAAPIKLTINAMTQAGTTKERVTLYFKKLIEQRSSGRIMAVIKEPTGQTETTPQIIKDLLDHKIQIVMPQVSSLSYLDPYWKIIEYPYLYRSQEHLHHVLDKKIGHEFLTPEFQKQFRVLSVWEKGDKYLIEVNQTSQQKQNPTLEHMSQPTSGILETLLNNRGSCPITAPMQNIGRWKEATLPEIPVIHDQRKRISIALTEHSVENYLLLTSQEFWQTLPEDLKIIITDATEDATTYARELAQRSNTNATTKLKASSYIKVNSLSPNKRHLWRQKTLNFYSQSCNRSERKLIERIANYHPDE